MKKVEETDLEGYVDAYIKVTEEPKPPVVETPVQPNTPQSEYHTISKGDTLYSISRKYNTSVQELRILNGLKDNTISVGQQLRVR